MFVLTSDHMLITLPKHDLVTTYVSEWSCAVIKSAQKNGINSIIISGPSVTRSEVEKMIKEKSPKFLDFNGHGSDTIIAGHNNEPLIILGENDHLLREKIVHSFTCNSARRLGRSCSSDAFIGYSNKFFLCMNRFFTTRPLKDNYAGPVLESALEAPNQLVKGKTAKESYDKSQEKYQKMIDKYTLSNSKYTTEELTLILPVLEWNKRCQVLHGNGDIKIK